MIEYDPDEISWEQKATIWLKVIELCLEKNHSFDFSDFNESLGETMKKACAVRLAAQIACEECDWEFDEIVASMQEFLEKKQRERAA